MTSNNQHRFDSAASLVNFVGPDEPGWHHLFNHCFGCLSTNIWQFGMLIHYHMLPACHTNCPLFYHHVPPSFWSKSVIAGHYVVKAGWHVLYCLKTIKLAAYIHNTAPRPYYVQNVTLKSFSAFNSCVATTFHSTHTYIHGTPLSCSTVMQW
jgi:hypothetical protein